MRHTPLCSRMCMAHDTHSHMCTIAGHLLSHLLAAIPNLHTIYAQYDTHDASILANFVTAIPTSAPILPHETALLSSSLSYDTPTTPWRRIAGTVKSSVSYYQRIDSDSSAWGKASAVIDTPASSLLAWALCLDTNERKQNFAREEGTAANGSNLLRKLVTHTHTRSRFYVTTLRFSLGVSSRVFATWFTWNQEEDGSYTMGFSPIENFPDSTLTTPIGNLIKNNKDATSALRGRTKGFYKIIPLAPNVCCVTLVVQGGEKRTFAISGLRRGPDTREQTAHDTRANGAILCSHCG